MSPNRIVWGDTVVSYDQALDDDYLIELKKVQQDLIKVNQAYLQERASKRDQRLLSLVKSDKLPPFDVGDYVLVSYPNGPPHKLSSLYRGPMKIIEKKTPYIFVVADLLSNRESQVHVNRLRLLLVSDNVDEDDLKDLALADSQEFEVEKILEHKGKISAKTKMKFLVKWKDDDKPTWEPYENVQDLAALEDYIHEHPELKVL